MSQNPTTIVICGITGDLAQKKILPALYDMYVGGKLEKDTHIVGFSRREMSRSEIKTYVRELVSAGSGDIESFLNTVSYVSGQFDDPKSYAKLAEHFSAIDVTVGGCSNKLFYFSVPPNLYEMMAEHLSSAGLMIPCGGPDGFARVLIEKPFG